MIQALRNAIAAGVTAGPTIIASGMPITTTAGHCHFFGVRVDNEAEARKAVRQLVQDDADWIKVMATGGRMTKNSNIYRAQYTLNELQAIVDEADRLQRRVAAHVLSVEGIRLSVEAGVHTLEHCNWQDGNGQPDYDEDLVTLIKDKGIHVSVTIVGYMRELYRAYLRDPTTSPLPPALKARFQIEGDMFARGLNTFITSDAGVPQSHFAELHLSLAVAVTWLGLDPMTAVEAVTSRAACALGIDDRVGTLEVGKIADILVVHGDPLDEITTVGNVSAVFRGGRIVNVGGAVFSPDIREIGTLPYNSDRIHGWKPRL
jgi:imidazolonepropionase-like amidohydrolase